MKATTHSALAFACVFSLLLAPGGSWANNLAISNLLLRAPAAGKVEVRFDISWNNSWRDGVNGDAAWVFVKYSTDGGMNWSHATLADSGTNPAGFSGGEGTSLDIVVPSDKKGAFLQRAGAGTGTLANTNVTLLWDFAANGVSRTRSALIKVFAIEVVSIPAGTFWAGNTNGVISSSFRAQSDANSPVCISSTNTFDIYYGTGAGTKATVPSTYPSGYAAFYLMKTEISQRQYCDFLNTLNVNQQANRRIGGLGNDNRNAIKRTAWSPPSRAVFGCDANNNAGPTTAVTNTANLNEADDGEWVACNTMMWVDFAAYADWSGLRPITELEFEKACRGSQLPVENEYAWGDTSLEAPATASLIATNTAQEIPDQGNCNYETAKPFGPYRCGSYARGGSDRINAGAGYYGVLDLSGSLWEWTVTVGNAAGLGYTGSHGDGELTANGHADVAGWPGLLNKEITGADGAGRRGGSWVYGVIYLRVADRTYSTHTAENLYGVGARAARTAP